MAITLDALAQALTDAESPKPVFKAGATTEGAGTWLSLWKIAGYPTAAASPPVYTAGSGYIPTRTTSGAIGQTNPAGGNNKYLAALSANSSAAGQLTVYDRLWACSGMTTNSVTTLTVTTPGTLTAARDPFSGLDVEPWIEIYTAPGVTGATWTLTGTDSTGTASRTWTYAHPANAETVGQIAPMVPLTAIGGCRVATSLAFNIASGTAGDVGITLMRRLATVSVAAANVENFKDAFTLGLPEVYDDACLAFMVLTTGGNSGNWMVHMSLAEMTP